MPGPDFATQNMLRTGTVTAVKVEGGRHLAKVDIHGRESDWMPVAGVGNAKLSIYIPMHVGEQVEVHAEFGSADGGTIHRAGFNDAHGVPEGADGETAVITFADGARITYGLADGALDVTAVGKATITVPEIECQCDTFHVTGDTTIDGALQVGEDISTDGSIEDGRGDLTNFNTTDGAARA